MAYDNQRGGGFQQRGPSQKFQGDWQCSKCGVKIAELPFEPDPSRMDQLLCFDCHKEKVRSFRR